MLTRLSKILIGALVVILLVVAIAYYANFYLLQQKEIKLLQGTRLVVTVPVASISATHSITATPSALPARAVYVITPSTAPVVGGVK